jgi:hypothetical protein
MLREGDQQLENYRASEIYTLMPLLRTGVLHSTSIDGYKGIRETGKILPTTGDLPFSYPQSRTYYGYSMGWVCLFDFESAREEDYGGTHHLWSDFFLSHKRKHRATIVLKLNRLQLEHKLILNCSRPKLGEPGYKPAIAYIEAWYPEAIPTSAIYSYIVTWRNRIKRLFEFQEFSIETLEQLDEKISWIQQEDLNG